MIVVNDFFTLINESFSHLEQLLARQNIVAVAHRARPVLDASHLEQIHSV